MRSSGGVDWSAASMWTEESDGPARILHGGEGYRTLAAYHKLPGKSVHFRAFPL